MTAILSRPQCVKANDSHCLLSVAQASFQLVVMSPAKYLAIQGAWIVVEASYYYRYR